MTIQSSILPLALGFFFGIVQPLFGANGQLELTTIDKETGKPIPCRMHLMNAKGVPRRPDKVTFWNDHFAVPGNVVLHLPLGEYSFVMERGLEYLEQNGRFTINVFADDSKSIELRRFADLASEGWYSGDLDIRRSPSEIEQLMLADDLHFGEVVSWGDLKLTGKEKPLPKKTSAVFDTNRFYDLLGGIASRDGGEVLFHRLSGPIQLSTEGKTPATLIQKVVEAKKQKDAWIEIANPASWDLPTLIALGTVDSIQVANSRLCRDKNFTDEAGGRPRDKRNFPDPWGSAQWSQEVYFRLLECGLQIPPSAGSGSGVAPNPVGHNRVYVHLADEFNAENWWQGLREGKVFLTNGPLMRVTVEGHPPGHVFSIAQGQTLELEIALTLSTREPIHYLEILKNGKVDQSIRFEHYAEQGKLPKVTFTESGWFIVRAVCDSKKTYHFAMTGPYYVHLDQRPRVSKNAAQFFLDWVYERAKQIKNDDPKVKQELLAPHRQARDYWKKLVDDANAE